MQRTAQDAWSEILGIIRDNISRQSFRTWFEPLQAVGLEKDQDGALILTILLPSRFYHEWLEEHYFALIRKTVMTVLGAKAKLIYEIQHGKEGAKISSPEGFRRHMYADDIDAPLVLRVAISPGRAPDDEIAEVLARLSIIYRKMGGEGIEFELEGIATARVKAI